VWFFVPETKGVPLEHMAFAFGHEDLVSDHQRLSHKEEEIGRVCELDSAKQREREMATRL
jgi:hypothetical protein